MTPQRHSKGRCSRSSAPRHGHPPDGPSRLSRAVWLVPVSGQGAAGPDTPLLCPSPGHGA